MAPTVSVGRYQVASVTNDSVVKVEVCVLDEVVEAYSDSYPSSELLHSDTPGFLAWCPIIQRLFHQYESLAGWFRCSLFSYRVCDLDFCSFQGRTPEEFTALVNVNHRLCEQLRCRVQYLGCLGGDTVKISSELLLFFNCYLQNCFQLLLNPCWLVAIAIEYFQRFLKLRDYPFWIRLCPIHKVIDDPLSWSLCVQDVSSV
mgnify:CR=1 FL=1